MKTESKSEFSDYKSLSRSERAERISKADHSLGEAAKIASPDDWGKESDIKKSLWMVFIHQMDLSAAEIAESILLRDPLLMWWERGAPVNAIEQVEANRIIDRAMNMAAQWNDDGYADCFPMAPRDRCTELGWVMTIRSMAKSQGWDSEFANRLEAGAIAADVASEVRNFFAMTEKDAPTAVEASAT
jgi:hypothetical protein